ncbi:hypothetical protein GCM10027416_22170 [Okibacterium endophyticum]
MTLSQTQSQLAAALRTTDAWTSVYIDVSGGVNDPERTGELRRRTVSERLRDAGAPAADIDAVERELMQPNGLPDPVSRFILAKDGRIELSEVLSGAMLSSEVTEHGRVARIVPLVRHRPSEFHYLVALVDREGGEVRLYCAGHTTAIDERSIDGETEHLSKVQVGGMSHARYQHHAEEVWKHNQSDIATAINELVTSHRARVLVLAGDLRAVQLLEEKLAPAGKEIASHVPVHGRADGASRAAVLTHLAERLNAVVESDAREALDTIGRAHGRDGALGVGPVVSALQQGQADTVLIDTNRLGDRTLLALDAEPWVATAPEEAAGAGIIERIDAETALARAAILTGAGLVFVDLINNGTALPEHAEAAAVLRWPTGPAVPGVQDINS